MSKTYYCPSCRTTFKYQKRSGFDPERVRLAQNIPKEFFDPTPVKKKKKARICLDCDRQFKNPYLIYLGRDQQAARAIMRPSIHLQGRRSRPRPRPRPRPKSFV